MGGCRCTYRTCKQTSDKSTHFFHYPVFDKQRCHQWIVNARRPNMLDLTLAQLKNRVVCQHHFKDDMFMNFKKDKLRHDAIPTQDGPFLAQEDPRSALYQSEDDKIHTEKIPNISNDDSKFFTPREKYATFSVPYNQFLTKCNFDTINDPGLRKSLASPRKNKTRGTPMIIPKVMNNENTDVVHVNMASKRNVNTIKENVVKNRDFQENRDCQNVGRKTVNTKSHKVENFHEDSKNVKNENQTTHKTTVRGEKIATRKSARNKSVQDDNLIKIVIDEIGNKCVDSKIANKHFIDDTGNRTVPDNIVNKSIQNSIIKKPIQDNSEKRVIILSQKQIQEPLPINPNKITKYFSSPLKPTLETKSKPEVISVKKCYDVPIEPMEIVPQNTYQVSNISQGEQSDPVMDYPIVFMGQAPAETFPVESISIHLPDNINCNSKLTEQSRVAEGSSETHHFKTRSHARPSSSIIKTKRSCRKPRKMRGLSAALLTKVNENSRDIAEIKNMLLQENRTLYPSNANYYNSNNLDVETRKKYLFDEISQYLSTKLKNCLFQEMFLSAPLQKNAHN